MGYEVDEATLDAYAQHLLQTLEDEKEEKFCTTQEKRLKVHQEQVAFAIRKKMTKVAMESVIGEGHDRVEVEQKVKILEARRKEEMKEKRKEEREAQKADQTTPNMVLVQTKTSKKYEASSTKPASPKPVEPTKKKQKGTRQYMTIYFEETNLDEGIKEIPKKKGVVREKQEEKKKEPVKETPRKSKITIHKRKPKSNEKLKSEAKRRTNKK